jgi:thioredoxin reductase
MIEAIVFRDGAVLPCQGLFFSPEQKSRSNLAANLGCKLDANGQIHCDQGQTTNVEGVFAIGNASPGLQLVIIAASEGTKAAMAINHTLHTADCAR